MKKEILLIEPISAITSWEAYEYQGHITLYVTLKKILELLQKNENVLDYDVQIEGQEDFSIRKNKESISLHQVKIGTINLDENDKFSFIIGILQSGAKSGVFHTSNNGKLPTDFVSKTLEHIDNLKKELNKKVIEKKDITNFETENDYIVVENISGNHKKGTSYRLIKYVSRNSKDIKKIETAIDQIISELDYYKTVIQDDKKKNESCLNLDDIYLLEYNDKFDNSKEVRDKAYEVIVEILKLRCPHYSFVDIDYSSLIYDCLFLYMKKIVTENYIERYTGLPCVLSFKDILEKIEVDYHEKIDTVAYQYFQVLKSIRNAFAKYSNDYCKISNCNDCKDSIGCNLLKEISDLNSKSALEIENIIHNLILCTPQIGKNNNLPHDDLISDLFLKLLKEIKILHLTRNNVYQAIKDDGMTYRLTLDSSCNKEQFQKKMIHELKKHSDRSLLFECDVLITNELREESLFIDGGKINVLTEKELDDIKGLTSFTIENIRKDCNKPKVIRLVDKKIALGELK